MSLGANALGSESDIRAAFIGDGLYGWIQSSSETDPSVLRAARFRFDGEQYRLSIAGFKPIRFGARRMWTAHMRDPSGPWINFVLMWEDPDLRLTLTFQPDDSIKATVAKTFGGKVSTVPRVLVSVLKKETGEHIGLGALASLDQGPPVVAETLKFFEPNGHYYVSFDMVEEQKCKTLIDANTIIVRK